MKQKIKHYLVTIIIPFILQILVRIIYFSAKKRFHHSVIKQDETYVVALWHGDLLMQPFNYKKLRPTREVRVIVSKHKDGEAIRKTVAYLGIGSITGSSSKGGAKALITAIKALKKGIDVAITPDGPRGPIYSVADGIVAISQKTGAKILPFSSKPSRYWQINSWDKFIVPKPFCVIDFYAGEPFDVDGLTMKDAKKKVLEKMMQNQLDK